MTDNETAPQRARRLAGKWLEDHFLEWSPRGRKWLGYAFTKGYQAASEELADHIDALVDQWEAHDDQQRFADDLSVLLNRYDNRGIEGVAA